MKSLILLATVFTLFTSCSRVGPHGYAPLTGDVSFKAKPSSEPLKLDSKPIVVGASLADALSV
ncbi:MAG: hypothetical protein ABIZ04_14375 [Opitutus sp.]